MPTGNGSKTLEDATVVELLAATRALTSSSKKSPRSPARVALEKTLSAVSSLKTVRVTERGGVVSFTGVPLAALGRFMAALAKAKLPS